ncbi:MAG: hydrogenase expression/formation protein HypE [Thermodesulfovibrionales bacterium]|nr:hydrogenase expression/formation protein HypE [Thermodesulfovibrionales bacterium]
MKTIQLGHGGGGKLMQELIQDLFQPIFELEDLNDSAVIVSEDLYNSHKDFKIAFTTDSYVVSPIFFPGGNIGDLAINGTINDLSVVGATAKYISVGLIIEEGFPIEKLQQIIISMAKAAKRVGVKIITGDTKVTEKGKSDLIFINTTGLGLIPKEVEFSLNKITSGDKIIISGPIGNHGIAVLAERYGLFFEPKVISDTAPLNELVEKILKYHCHIRIMRDPTRGGISSALNELSIASGYEFIIYEELIPYSKSVKGACELLGLDILEVANEGILLAIVSPSMAEMIVKLMQSISIGEKAAIIGEVGSLKGKGKGLVILKTPLGGSRVISMPLGEQLPRIC